MWRLVSRRRRGTTMSVPENLIGFPMNPPSHAYTGVDYSTAGTTPHELGSSTLCGVAPPGARRAVSAPAMHTSRSTTTSRRLYCGAPRGVTFRFPEKLRNFRRAGLQPAISTPACPLTTPRARAQRRRHTACLSAVGLSLGPPSALRVAARSLPICLCLCLGFRRGGSSAADDAERPCPSLRIRLDSQ